jgi:putative polymerase
MSVAGVPAWHPGIAARGPLWLRPPFIAVLAAMTFNFFLCFINTNVTSVGTAAVIGSEIAIIIPIMLYTYRTLDYTQFLFISSAILYLVALSAARALFGDGFDVKPIRDLLIPIAFFMLGSATGDARAADRIVTTAVLIVIAVGIFEYVFPDVYTRFFNIAGFYIERGSMDTAQAQQSSNLFVSGLRPEGFGGGRNLFPFLGNHRVSSIFLEPVSTGNFGIIVFMWALVRSLIERRIFWGLFASALLVVVMADSRFGAYFCAICLLLAICPANIRLAITALLPLCGLLIVVFLSDTLSAHYGVDNGFIGRIILSGRILAGFDELNWFGLAAPGFVTADSGYAYTLAGFGVIGLAMFWIMLLAIRGDSRWFYLFRDLTSAYCACLLCISSSPYTIKTGSLLWFLAGVLQRSIGVSNTSPGFFRRPREISFVRRKAGSP